jgi:3-oxoadipate enol-lactonase
MRSTAPQWTDDAIPGSQFEVWPDAAHQPFQEEPARFNARLEAFWTSLPRG